MTRKAFWDDPYQTRIDTEVTAVDADRVRVAETIFYAFSGGQESDAGTFAGLPVLEANKSDKEIDYRLPGGHGLRVGDRVAMEIDWQRRYCLMRLHFAAELVLEIVTKNLPEVVKVGAHIAADKARIDFQWPENIAPLLPGIAAEANGIVAADGEIVSAFSDEGLERRYWKIAGFAEVPCGGTHLKKTGEVGVISLKRKNIGKGKERIEIRLDSPESICSQQGGC